MPSFTKIKPRLTPFKVMHFDWFSIHLFQKYLFLKSEYFVKFYVVNNFLI